VSALMVLSETLDVESESKFFLQALICKGRVVLGSSFKVKAIAKHL
jgi:urease accessory protein UreH